MRGLKRQILLIAIFVTALIFSSCAMNAEHEYWESSPIEGKPNSVTIELSDDVDFLVWTKLNSEPLLLPIPRGKKFKDTLCFSKGSHTFTFKEPGVYVLTIHQKSDNEEKDLRGKVIISEQAIKITDKGYSYNVQKHALYTISNDSSILGEADTIKELIYISYVERKWDSKRKHNYGIYKTDYKYKDLNIAPGKSMQLLLPMTTVTDSRYGGLILKPIKKNGELLYFGQTTMRQDRYSIQGARDGTYNGIFTPIENNRFEYLW